MSGLQRAGLPSARVLATNLKERTRTARRWPVQPAAPAWPQSTQWSAPAAAAEAEASPVQATAGGWHSIARAFSRQRRSRKRPASESADPSQVGADCSSLERHNRLHSERNDFSRGNSATHVDRSLAMQCTEFCMLQGMPAQRQRTASGRADAVAMLSGGDAVDAAASPATEAAAAAMRPAASPIM